MTDTSAQAGATEQAAGAETGNAGTTSSGANGVAGSGNAQKKTPNIFGGINQPASSSQDPLRMLIEIAKDPGLSDAEKETLIQVDRERFVNRRRMAYLALFAILGTLVFVLAAAILDASPDRMLACATAAKAGGTTLPDCGAILISLTEAQTLLSWIMGFLASIVGAYYGFSSLRPSS